MATHWKRVAHKSNRLKGEPDEERSKEGEVMNEKWSELGYAGIAVLDREWKYCVGVMWIYCPRLKFPGSLDGLFRESDMSIT